MTAVVSSFLPATHTALKVVGSNKLVVTKDAALPGFDTSEVLVRVSCISVNPVDAKSVEMSPTSGATVGTDFSGVVVALGSDVDTEKWHVSDRVMGGIFGNNPLRHENGAFAEYLAVPAQLLWHIPADMDFTTAASLPTALATIGMSLFQYLQLPMPNPSGPLQPESRENKTGANFVLVYGGGTASGAMAIQVLRLLGLTPITTCSTTSAARSRELGASATFDYSSPNCGTEILEYTAGSLKLALDCISDLVSMEICYKAIGPAGGRYLALDPFPIRGHTRRSVKPDWICAYTQFGHAIPWAPPFDLDARLDDRESAEAWYPLAQLLLDRGLLVSQPLELRQGGLAAIEEAMYQVRKGQIKGKKLVVQISH